MNNQGKNLINVSLHRLWFDFAHHPEFVEGKPPWLSFNHPSETLPASPRQLGGRATPKALKNHSSTD